MRGDWLECGRSRGSGDDDEIGEGENLSEIKYRSLRRITQRISLHRLESKEVTKSRYRNP